MKRRWRCEECGRLFMTYWKHNEHKIKEHGYRRSKNTRRLVKPKEVERK